MYLIVSGSLFKACKYSEFVDKPPLLATFWLLEESLVFRDCGIEYSAEELPMLLEDTGSASSFISSITNPIKQWKLKNPNIYKCEEENTGEKKEKQKK